MKLVVPLTIPSTFSIRVAARLSWITRITGTTPATAASKRSWTPAVAGGGEQLVAVLGDELLVRGDHVLARLQRAEHVVARRVGAADQLDDDLRVGEDLVEVALGSAQDAGELRPPAADRLDLERALGELLDECAADGPPPEDTDARPAQTSRAVRSS